MRIKIITLYLLGVVFLISTTVASSSDIEDDDNTSSNLSHMELEFPLEEEDVFCFEDKRQFKEAAKEGNIFAQVAYANLSFEKGKREKAAKWYLTAAKQKDMETWSYLDSISPGIFEFSLSQEERIDLLLKGWALRDQWVQEIERYGPFYDPQRGSRKNEVFKAYPNKENPKFFYIYLGSYKLSSIDYETTNRFFLHFDDLKFIDSSIVIFLMSKYAVSTTQAFWRKMGFKRELQDEYDYDFPTIDLSKNDNEIDVSKHRAVYRSRYDPLLENLIVNKSRYLVDKLREYSKCCALFEDKESLRFATFSILDSSGINRFFLLSDTQDPIFTPLEKYLRQSLLRFEWKWKFLKAIDPSAWQLFQPLMMTNEEQIKRVKDIKQKKKKLKFLKGEELLNEAIKLSIFDDLLPLKGFYWEIIENLGRDLQRVSLANLSHKHLILNIIQNLINDTREIKKGKYGKRLTACWEQVARFKLKILVNIIFARPDLSIGTVKDVSHLLEEGKEASEDTYGKWRQLDAVCNILKINPQISHEEEDYTLSLLEEDSIDLQRHITLAKHLLNNNNDVLSGRAKTFLRSLSDKELEILRGPQFTLYGDGQNAHDPIIVKNCKDAIKMLEARKPKKIEKWEQKVEDAFQQARNIIANFQEALSTLEELEKDRTPIFYTVLSPRQIFQLVWDSIQAHKEKNPEEGLELTNILIQQLEEGHNVCMPGKVERLIQTLEQFSISGRTPLEIKISGMKVTDQVINNVMARLNAIVSKRKDKEELQAQRDPILRKEEGIDITPLINLVEANKEKLFSELKDEFLKGEVSSKYEPPSEEEFKASFEKGIRRFIDG